MVPARKTDFSLGFGECGVGAFTMVARLVGVAVPAISFFYETAELGFLSDFQSESNDFQILIFSFVRYEADALAG